ncbi:putative versatile peroxidase VPL1 [Colletotrichum sublineola]|uniref:Peroxidase n=1 Tax=Colletotrichum sublineola TaxID=1173701 RepID=A0A066X6A6_COLSU|nr:putative versatile peroxidase VPL1 [Colletotrichum sublineola]
MHTSSLLLTGLLAFSNAAVLPQAEEASLLAARGGGSGSSSGNSCHVWAKVNAELNSAFMVGKQCNGMARAAIRAIFHDCGSWDTTQGFTGGCDGSLVLGTTYNGQQDVELNRDENRGLQKIASVLQDMATRYAVSVADMIVFAGNAAIFLCPGGPRVKTFIGPTDSTTSAKPGGLPDVFDTAQNLFTLFQNKGYSAEDLAALLGAHSTSTQNFVGETKKNASQDSTLFSIYNDPFH